MFRKLIEQTAKAIGVSSMYSGDRGQVLKAMSVPPAEVRAMLYELWDNDITHVGDRAREDYRRAAHCAIHAVLDILVDDIVRVVEEVPILSQSRAGYSLGKAREDHAKLITAQIRKRINTIKDHVDMEFEDRPVESE